MKLTVTGISDIINYKDKRTNSPKQAVRVAGLHPTSQMHGFAADTYFVELSLLGGVIPNEGDVLSIDFDGNFIDTIEWLSHASKPAAPSTPQTHNSPAQNASNGNNAAK